MKIDRLDLRAFGPFTDLTLALDRGDLGLHVVYGPNEAGKSSALRALRQLFYGIPSRSTDNFVHAYPELRIGATLSEGVERLECIRRKANKNDLRAGDDVTPLEPGVLSKYLAGLDRETFETMFGIDHPALVQGGRDLLGGGGNLGQILFAAAAGIADLRSVQQRLGDEAAALFVPKGSNPRINRNLAEWDKARKEARAAELPSSEWEQHDKTLAQARRKQAELEAKLAAAIPEKSRLERVRQALPLLAKRNQLLTELTGLGPVPLLADEFSDRRRDAVAALSTARITVESGENAIRELDSQIAQLEPPAALLARGEAVEGLQNDLGGYRKAQRDRPILAGRRDQLMSDARRILAHLRPDLTLAEAESLRLTKKQEIELQNLGNQHGALTTRIEQARRNFEKRDARLQAARRELAGLESPRNFDSLLVALRRAQSLGDVEQDRAAARIELTRLEGRTVAELARLGLWTGDLEALERLPLPAAESIDRAEQAHGAAERALERLAEQCDDNAANQAALERQLRQLELQGAVPAETDLVESRRRREVGWRLVRAQWLERERDLSAERAFLAEFAPLNDLAAAYEQAVRQADEQADRLRREADRVATRAGFLADRQACQAEFEKLAAQRREAESQRRGLMDAWNAAWQALAVAPLTPREMRPWVVKQQALVQQSEALRRHRTSVGELERRIATARGDLDRALTELGEIAAEESLAVAVERALLASERNKVVVARRATLETELASLGPEVAECREQSARACQELAGWGARWRAAVEPLGLPADATPAQVHEVLSQIHALFDKLKDAASFSERIADIGREAEQFRTQVADLVGQLAPDLAGLAVDEAAERLIDSHRQAITHEARLDAARKQREKHAIQREQARQAIREAEGAMDALCQEAHCEAAERLPEIEQASTKAKGLHVNLAHVHDNLLLLGAPATVEEFIAEIGGVEADDLPVRIDALSAQIAGWNEEREQASNTVAVEGKALADMDTSAAAADAAERAQSLLAEIGSDVEEYVRLRLASAVLREAIERYRKKNQGPVLERASSLFAELTAGSFAGLRADYDDAGEAVLVGARPDGRTVGVDDAMSDGTRDQLYLALRLASLENYLIEKQPIPFIVDDILIKFDNERSIATLKVLAGLSKRTQVIFFTHHQHLVELAEQHLDGAELFVHRLEGKTRSL
ncbi:MAG TPA: AAA family ATPase [Pirellulales bacterium]|nr:AAA family ATPase [Pirellulales bacterium]